MGKINSVLSNFIKLQLLLLPVVAISFPNLGQFTGFLLLLSIFYLILNRRNSTDFAIWEKLFCLSSVQFFIIVCINIFLTLDGRISYDFYSEFLIVVILYSCFRRLDLDEKYLWFSFILGLISIGIWGIVDVYILHKVRAEGATQLAISYGNISLCLIIMLLASWSYSYTRWERVIIIFACFCGLLGVLLSLSRGLWLAVPSTSLLLGFFAGKRILYYKKWLLAASLGVAAIFVITVNVNEYNIIFRINEGVTNLADSYNSEKTVNLYTSVGQRLELFKIALKLFLNNPIKGVGVGNYTAYINHQIDLGVYPAYTLGGRAHNDVLNILAEMGIIGLVSFLILVFTPLVLFIKFFIAAKGDQSIRRYSMVGILLIISYLHFGLTDTIFFNHDLKRLYLVNLCFLFCLIRQRT